MTRPKDTITNWLKETTFSASEAVQIIAGLIFN